VGQAASTNPGLPRCSVNSLHGEADARSPLANAKALGAAIPASQLVVLPQLCHACVVEDLEACAAQIRRFVTTISSPPPLSDGSTDPEEEKARVT
jgi:pimeloyl-ACP methyl ester carboxylesterase